MAERTLLAYDSDGFWEEIDTAADTTTLAGLTITTAAGIAMGSSKITGLANGTADGDAVNKGQLDAAIEGLDPKPSVRVSTHGLGNFALATAFENGDTIDGVVLATGDRVLISEQSTVAEDGIYVVQASGAPVRADDAQAGASFAGALVTVEEGTANADRSLLCTNNVGTDVVGTDDLVFVTYSTNKLVFGDGLDKTGDTVSVDITADIGLHFNGGKLEIELDNTPDTLDADADGLKVVGLPSLFKINDVAVGAGVTAANLDTLTDGSNADALHVHSGADEAQRVENNYTVGTGGVTAGDPVFINASGEVEEADAATIAEGKKVIGIAKTTEIATATVSVVSAGLLTGLSGLGGAGNIVYLAVGGGLTTSKPGSGNFICVVGISQAATALHVEIAKLGKAA